jgi:ABC-type polysaccharide/polyol phosphate transport system ATPase subunit
MKKIMVEIRGLHKDFILPQSKNSTFKQTVVNIVKRNKRITQRVLDGVDFDVHKGDFFGIVGRNGSGKSTLLKLIAGVYTPTRGHIKLNGGLTPFIELGVGFNPELSGRDNVYLNGALLGFDRKQMNTVYDEIVEFAELGQFMDQKLKNYSSGMQVRLAFSIAIKAKNDILIFDEVLAVGDEAFQRKCLDVFEKYKAEGQTVILVTHDMETVRQFCTKAMLIQNGKIVGFGDPNKVATKYSEINQIEIDEDISRGNKGAVGKSFIDVALRDDRGLEKVSYSVNQAVFVGLDWDSIDGVKSVGVNIFKQSGEHITGVNTLKDGLDVNNKKAISLSINLPLRPGNYYIIAEVFAGVGRRIGSNENNPMHFSVTYSDVSWSGLFDIPHKWIC